MHIDPKTRRWWTLLRAVAVLNIALWAALWALSERSGWYHQAQLTLAGIYTLICASRSFIPRVDLERTVLLDHWLSNIVIGRSSATLAEMAFTAQLSLLFVQLSSYVPWLEPAGYALLVIIAVAQLTCWAGVVTGNHLWHAAEELLWSVLVVITAAAGAALWPHAQGAASWLIGLGWLGALSALVVMSGLDVPMYLRRWRQSKRDQVVYRTWAEGFADALRRREVTGEWSVWRHEVWWMTPYFSFGVWLSLALAWFEPRL
ncbi:MAG TPA: hypothetical protein DCQ06_09695 [Myxococcales bacterium]|nr:hypothetical protein [Myxococcales bacterium]HAN31857.1 hypothetical protein [Myxococcales bacterium]